MRLSVQFAALCLAASLAQAMPADRPLANSALEARANVLFHELRCVVCEGQSVADSDAALAGDMRRMIRQRIVAGESDDRIKNYLVARYGEQILMRPPMASSTWLLWSAPVLFLMAGALTARRFLLGSKNNGASEGT